MGDLFFCLHVAKVQCCYFLIHQLKEPFHFNVMNQCDESVFRIQEHLYAHVKYYVLSSYNKLYTCTFITQWVPSSTSCMTS